MTGSHPVGVVASSLPTPNGLPLAVESSKTPRLTTGIAVAALGLAAAGAVTGGIALTRSLQPTTPAVSAASPHASITSSPDQIAAAKREACDAWSAAASAINAARHPFVVAPPNWDDPVTASALVQAESSIAIQVAYVRQHIPSATPAEVATPIADYLSAAIDTAAADGQHQPDSVANAAADRSGAATKKIKAACGI